MGSVAQGEDEQQPITVLLTGFAVSLRRIQRTTPLSPPPLVNRPPPNTPTRDHRNNANLTSQPFKKDYPVNPSWEIVRGLPDWLPPLRAKTVTSTPVAPAPAPGPDHPAPVTIPPVRLLIHPEPIRVNYTVVRDLVPKLWHLHPPPASSDDNPDATTTAAAVTAATATAAPAPEGEQPHRRPPKIDLAIHVGMAGPRAYYSIERRGHRDGYVMPDVDGRFLREDDERRARRGEAWVWEGVPAELETALDLGDVLSRWRGWAPVCIFFLFLFFFFPFFISLLSSPFSPPL
jgi:hypothetical protein